MKGDDIIALYPIKIRKFSSIKKMMTFMKANRNNITVTVVFKHLLEIHYVEGNLQKDEFIFTNLPNQQKGD